MVLIVTMYWLFRRLTAVLGYPTGYLVAFSLYWVGWCTALPLAVLGPRRVAALFAPGLPVAVERRASTVALVSWPILFPLLFAFLRQAGRAGVSIVAASIVLGVVTGVAEEVLWRGVYLELFRERVAWNTVYPSLAFGLWHIAPLSVLPSRYPGGVVSFGAYSILLGLSYATAARRTRSIRWITISHCIHDTLGLGGFVYAAWLA
jgi:membrane protease YdiL (CAAX protease family)